MPLALDDVRRYARQIALPDIGVAGQERIAAAEVVLVGQGAIVDTAELYLRAAGVGRLRRAPGRSGSAGLEARATEAAVELTSTGGASASIELLAPEATGAPAVLAGALAATEALWLIVGRDGATGAARLRLPLDGSEVGA
jgi:hypothetical protein